MIWNNGEKVWCQKTSIDKTCHNYRVTTFGENFWHLEPYTNGRCWLLAMDVAIAHVLLTGLFNA